ncbi:Kae1-associated serine/threonine protein kinase [Candidatus Pacearchaeota archaeon]|nr:Kae1-associated serine/threonine protein kinase [Candidatus Pacearchaeota archaeon]
MTQKIFARGAEAVIILKDNLVTKDRIKKSYRIKELDEKIRKRRTKSEKKLLEKASKIINAPNPFPLKEEHKIEMPFIDGKKISDILDSFPIAKQKQICKTIGQQIAKMHDADIIHGDLTTSNMICDSASLHTLRPKIFFIDFGLGYISKKIEDRAVDLHLLKQALEAKHFKDWEVLFKSVLDGYKDYKESPKVLERLLAVERRGRYKH